MSKKEKNMSVPGFWDGFMAMFGHKASYDTPHTTDAEAMRSDWEAVGRDIRTAINKINL